MAIVWPSSCGCNLGKPMSASINAQRLLARIEELGGLGLDQKGRRTRLAGSDGDKLGRDAFVAWARAAGLAVRIDRIGNMFAILGELSDDGPAPLLLGSHIDTVVDAGALDGCYGVLAGLEVLQVLKEDAAAPPFPVVVAAFTNEEGVRYAPDMMGSAVFAGTVSLEAALSSVAPDGTSLGEELQRIGYAGVERPGFFRPRAYVELHIEQGPVLENEGLDVGIVEGVQGISWQRVTIGGQANHAGTTPMTMRRDAGVAAARIVTFLDTFAREQHGNLVATVGCLTLAPHAINVVPGGATLTIDMRSPDATLLMSADTRLTTFLRDLGEQTGCAIGVERLARTDPVPFDQKLVLSVERIAAERGLASRCMTSGAGHDAQMIAPIAPTAMLFVPSSSGISHNPLEHTPDRQLVVGAELLLAVVRSLLVQ